MSARGLASFLLILAVLIVAFVALVPPAVMGAMVDALKSPLGTVFLIAAVALGVFGFLSYVGHWEA